METFSDIIEAFGGGGAFADAIGITPAHAYVLKHRNTIPARFWTRTVAAAQARRIKGVSVEMMAMFAAREAE